MGTWEWEYLSRTGFAHVFFVETIGSDAPTYVFAVCGIAKRWTDMGWQAADDFDRRCRRCAKKLAQRGIKS